MLIDLMDLGVDILKLGLYEVVQIKSSGAILI